MCRLTCLTPRAWVLPAALLLLGLPALPNAMAAPESAAVAARFAPPGEPPAPDPLAPSPGQFSSQAQLQARLVALAALSSAGPAAPAARPAPPASVASAASAASAALAASAPALPAAAASAPAPPAAAAATRATLLQIGSSAGGLPITALLLQRRTDAPLVLLVGQQHGDEPLGAEVLLATAGELLQGALAPLLEQVSVLLLPRANPDGAQAGRRGNAAGADINRDHLLLRTPEARALAALVALHRPVLVVDVHEYAVGPVLVGLGAVPRDDVQVQGATTPNLPGAIGQLSDTGFVQPLLASLAGAGFQADWYASPSGLPGDARLAMGSLQADSLRNVAGLRHAVALLLEGRGADLGRLHLPRRQQALQLAIATLLRQAAAQAGALLATQQAADAALRGMACSGSVVVLARQMPGSRTVALLHPQTGADVSLDVPWLSSLQQRPRIIRSRPCGYWLAADQAEAVAALQALGLQVLKLERPLRLPAEAWVPLAGSEGQPTPVLDLQPLALDAPAGSWWLPLAQPGANLALAALEPDAPGSWWAERRIGRLDAVRRISSLPPADALQPGPGAGSPDR